MTLLLLYIILIDSGRLADIFLPKKAGLHQGPPWPDQTSATSSDFSFRRETARTPIIVLVKQNFGLGNASSESIHDNDVIDVMLRKSARLFHERFPMTHETTTPWAATSNEFVLTRSSKYKARNDGKSMPAPRATNCNDLSKWCSHPNI